MLLNGAEIIIKLLEKRGIDIVTGVPGGANLPMYDALNKSNIKHILARHEQGGGFISHGISRTTGKAAVCFATSGPGVTNLLTAIADAKLDSVPLVAITGQVSLSYIGTDAFQEVDTYGLTIPITKHNFLVRSVEELFHVIPEAFEIAESGRPGPVLIDVPKDIQVQKIEFDEWPDYSRMHDVNDNHKLTSNYDVLKLLEAARIINNAKKPIIYAGGGILHSGASEYLYELSKKSSIPTALTLMALGCFPPDSDLYLGMLGMHGARYTNMLMHEADLIIVLGARFDDRATGNVEKFCPNASVIHIDIDQSEIDKNKKSNLSISGDLSCILKDLIPKIQDDNREEWNSKLEMLKKEFPFPKFDATNPYDPVNFIKNLSNILGKDAIITTDVGQHQMWTAQSYPFFAPRKFLTSGGLGTMGFGLPTAIGAALENPEENVVSISGDGSILMNIQELATLADFNLNVKIIIMNNGNLGLVRQQQELFYNQNYIASTFITNPDFVAIAKGFGIKAYSLKDNENPQELLEKVLLEKGPCLINVPIDPSADVVPMVVPGKANTEMIGG